jgi:hypothetical protein
MKESGEVDLSALQDGIGIYLSDPTYKRNSRTAAVNCKQGVKEQEIVLPGRNGVSWGEPKFGW